jgi:hypothetical protein
MITRSNLVLDLGHAAEHIEHEEDRVADPGFF